MSENNSERINCIIKIKKPLKLKFKIRKKKQFTNYYIVYKTINLVNNKFYVGVHLQKNIDPYKFDGYWGTSKYLQNSINKYGEENFVRETIEVCKTYEDALEREKFWIAELKSNIYKYPDGLGMNRNDGGWGGKDINKGGKGGTFQGHHHTEESKNKISKGNSGKKRTPEQRKKMGEQRKGKKLPEETVEKMNKNRKVKSGKDHYLYGKSPSDETKKKMSEKRKGRKTPKEVVDKIANSNRGKKHTEESKKKMSENHPDVSGEKNSFYGHHHTEEFKKSLSEKRKGKCFLEKHTEESKKKISKSATGERNTFNKYIYFMSNGKNFWEFFDKKERGKIMTIFSKSKKQEIIYNGITITRTLKESENNGTKI